MFSQTVSLLSQGATFRTEYIYFHPSRPVGGGSEKLRRRRPRQWNGLLKWYRYQRLGCRLWAISACDALVMKEGLFPFGSSSSESGGWMSDDGHRRSSIIKSQSRTNTSSHLLWRTPVADDKQQQLRVEIDMLLTTMTAPRSYSMFTSAIQKDGLWWFWIFEFETLWGRGWECHHKEVLNLPTGHFSEVMSWKPSKRTEAGRFDWSIITSSSSVWWMKEIWSGR